MKCLSKVFQPVITIPKNAKIKSTEITCKSQKLLLECGLVRPTSSGLFTLLPLACRALHKLETLIRHSMEEVGAQEVSLPALTAAGLWEKSGRLQLASAELMKVDDRHGKKYILAPTHEEGIADLLADVGPLSYKQLPIILYQISNKYRDEHRPKHGLLRAREFLMMDAYGVHASEECAAAQYAAVSAALARLFQRLQLPVYRVSAPAGDMGGRESHEWQLCAGAGEDAVRVCEACDRAAGASEAARAGEPAGASEAACAECGGRTHLRSSIEVAHTFQLGERYAAALGALAVPPAAPPRPLLMSCYGIGVTRLLAAALEARADAGALRWPTGVAPYDTLIIPPKEGSKEAAACAGRVREVHAAVRGAGGDALCDDRARLSIGRRLLLAARMGYPNVIVVGRAALEPTPRYELHRPATRDCAPAPAPALLTLDELRELAPAPAPLRREEHAA